MIFLYFLTIIFLMVYIYCYLFGAERFPKLYDSLYQKNIDVLEVETVEFVVKSSCFEIPDFFVTYSRSNESAAEFFPYSKTNLCLSITGEAYLIRRTRTTKTFWYSLLTRKQVLDVTDIYLPEKEYQELQAILSGKWIG